VILEADGNLVPATVAAGSVELEGFNRNRHSKIQPVPVDRRLGVLRLDDAASGTPVAVLVNFTAHPTSIPDDTMTFSADYIGSMRETIEAKLGGTAVFMQGASGDLSTDRNGQDHRAYGAALGRAAVELAESLKPEAVTRPSLEVREERFTFASRVDFTNPVIAGIYSLAFFPELIATFVAEYTDGIRPRITVALLNDSIALVGGSGEFFCQHAIRLRERARVDELFFFGYCNGYHQYFPTIEAAAEGGYGADTQVAPAEVGAGETMMNAALAWIYQLQGKL
jgi:neutral ceramidase